MKAKEFLNQVYEMDKKIEQDKAELMMLREDTLMLRGISYDGVRVASSKQADQMLNAMVKVEKMEKRIYKRIEKRAMFRGQTIEMIQKVKDPRYIQVLYERYIQYKRLDEIAQDMSYDVRHIKRLHGWALLAFARENGLSQ